MIPLTPHIEPITHFLQFFKHFDLASEELHDLADHFQGLAHKIVFQSSNRETVIALRKLLEAKDAAIRALEFQRSKYPPEKT